MVEELKTVGGHEGSGKMTASGGHKGYDLAELVLSVSSVIDLVEPRLADHHRRTAYVCGRLAREMALPPDRARGLTLAALIHDVGAFKLTERIGLLRFEEADRGAHCLYGARMFDRCGPLRPLASVISAHHAVWSEEAGAVVEDAWLLQLADRVAVGSRKSAPSFEASSALKKRVKAQRGKKFSPDAADAFMSVAEEESFWFDLYFGGVAPGGALGDLSGGEKLDIGGMLEVARFFSMVVDYRSHFTAAHSWGVAATAAELAAAAGWGGEREREMEAAGLLHDIGKMAVPVEIIEKPGKLDLAEWFVMKQHPYHTKAILDRVGGMETIREAGAYHHEHTGSRAYPFHLDPARIPAEAKLLAAADVFTALTETRPYREGLDYRGARAAMSEMVDSGALSSQYVRLLMKDFDRFDRVRGEGQGVAREAYMSLVS